ncbi:uncharacterized protein C8Q71DRAFT_863729 [Rhodofomes roseus]|uniref:Serine protease n=1 Tax=Rhodofomes roseus TaxID=34475 RepID=A0A4Y9Z459_9APHY|nr:uncharacterized protein C8Q71DRAFT_863729 [Rhodofomes roseus]KAH9828789.1 hypothetical protein C8Q71DRAFT_863729 [Rhodofomes roseus]TFY69362.1 hypothetical protein EVJ58_g462 [Rhodofomes roseus]
MAPKVYIPEEIQHPSWNGQLPDTIQADGLQFADLDVGSWTVKLEFRIGGQLATGSGFHINVPDCSKAIILTAGHNLLAVDGTRSTELAVLEPGEGPSGPAKYIVPDDDIHISKAFTGEHGKPAVDWGVILYPRDRFKGSMKDRGGFGYSLRLGHAQHVKGTLYVSGYQGVTMPGHPITSSGPLVAAYTDWLEYRPKTEQGISGSVVWTEYKGHPTVIAIHNSSPDPTKRKTGGSRGTRLTAALLSEVFRFANVGQWNVRLRAHGTPKQVKLLPKRGLFLCFPEGFPFARVRLGPGTAVNLLPAEVTKNTKQYAIEVQGKWALFNVQKQQVTLSADVREESLFTVMDKSAKNSKETAVEIVIEGKEKRMQVRVRGEKLKGLEDDCDDEDAESSEVSMVPYPSKETFVRFALEPASAEA